jgi:hypothetical protein
MDNKKGTITVEAALIPAKMITREANTMNNLIRLYFSKLNPMTYPFM